MINVPISNWFHQNWVNHGGYIVCASHPEDTKITDDNFEDWEGRVNETVKGVERNMRVLEKSMKEEIGEIKQMME